MTPNRPFPTPRRLRQAQFLISAFAVGLAAMAGESYDLTRTTPVPADQQIPAGDFFRPALAQEPRLNRAGTEIAAVVTAGEDRHLLLVYDVATRKYGMVGGNMDYDINEVRWLRWSPKVRHRGSHNPERIQRSPCPRNAVSTVPI